MRDELEARLDNLVSKDVDPDKAQAILRRLGQDHAKRGAFESGMHISAIFAAGVDYMALVVDSLSDAFSSIVRVSFDKRTKPQLETLRDDCIAKYDARAEFMRGQVDAVLKTISLQSKSVDNYEEKRNLLRGNLRARLTMAVDEAEAKDIELRKTQKISFKYALYGALASVLLSTAISGVLLERYKNAMTLHNRLDDRKYQVRRELRKRLLPALFKPDRALVALIYDRAPLDSLVPRIVASGDELSQVIADEYGDIEYAYSPNMRSNLEKISLEVMEAGKGLEKARRAKQSDSLEVAKLKASSVVADVANLRSEIAYYDDK